MWEGDFDYYKTCAQCIAIIDDLFCGQRTFECLRDDVWDQIGVDIVDGEIDDDEEGE